MLMRKQLSAASFRTARPADEQGFASIVIAIVLVLVLSLITVGFAQLMRNEERSALDKQLSSQAYYAAESGVNAATKAINSGYTGSKTDCAPDSSVPDLADNTIKYTVAGSDRNPTNASYPCLLINPAPPNLHYNPIATTLSRTVQFTAIDSDDQPAAVSRIKISWQDSGDNETFIPNCDNLRTSDQSVNPSYWTYIGMLRVMLVPLVNGSLDRDTLTNSAMTAFLCPNSGSLTNSVAYSSSIGAQNSGPMVYGNCRAVNEPNCSVNITNLPPNQATFFLNMRSLYSPTSVTVTAYNSAGTTLRLKDAQTLIDSTGKAQDVLRRIQVRVASKSGFNIPDGTHGDICKAFDLDPGVTSSSAPSNSGCDTTSLTY